jgi:hypothetical protein
MEARPLLVPGLKIGNVRKAHWPLVVIGDLHAAVRDAAIGAGLGCAGSPRVGWGLGAEVSVHAALAPDVAADVEGAGIHVGELLGPACLAVGLLGAADGVGDGVGHGRVALGQAQLLARLEVLAPGKTPGVFVELFDFLDRQVVGIGNFPASIVVVDVYSVAVAVGVWLRPDYVSKC